MHEIVHQCTLKCLLMDPRNQNMVPVIQLESFSRYIIQIQIKCSKMATHSTFRKIHRTVPSKCVTTFPCSYSLDSCKFIALAQTKGRASAPVKTGKIDWSFFVAMLLWVWSISWGQGEHEARAAGPLFELWGGPAGVREVWPRGVHGPGGKRAVGRHQGDGYQDEEQIGNSSSAHEDGPVVCNIRLYSCNMCAALCLETERLYS